MSPSIDLDDKLAIATSEVRDIRPDWALPDELETAELSIANVSPEHVLS